MLWSTFYCKFILEEGKTPIEAAEAASGEILHFRSIVAKQGSFIEECIKEMMSPNLITMSFGE